MKTWLIVTICVVVAGGLGVGAYFIFRKPKDTSKILVGGNLNNEIQPLSREEMINEIRKNLSFDKSKSFGGQRGSNNSNTGMLSILPAGYKFTHTLTPNATKTDTDVQYLQIFLNKKVNANLVENGKYGNATMIAVAKFQRNNGLIETGDFDTDTMNKVNASL